MQPGMEQRGQCAQDGLGQFNDDVDQAFLPTFSQLIRPYYRYGMDVGAHARDTQPPRRIDISDGRERPCQFP